MPDNKPAPVHGPPAPDPDKKPLDDTEVHVEAQPKSNSHDDRQKANKVKETVKQNVKDAIKRAAPDGAKKQLDAAEEAIDEARDKVSPSQVEKIKVKVKGKDGHGDEVERTRTVKPKEK